MREGHEMGALEQLKARQRRQLDDRMRLERRYHTFLWLAVLFVVASAFAVGLGKDLGRLVGSWLILYACLPGWVAFSTRAHLRRIDEALQDLDFEIDLQQFQVSRAESRAEKLFRLNSVQLRRYYDLNLRQNTWVFGLGVFCIGLGVGVVAGTIYVVQNVAENLDAKIISGALGSLGTFLTSYVAGIYLKMHSGATANLAAFHARLVGTQDLLLGNLLASRIDDEQKRWDTLAQLALKVAERR